MKKKLFLLLLLITAALLCSCNSNTEGNATESESAHVHTYGDWELTKEATCTEEGKKTGVCPCGDKIVEIIPVIDHVLVKTLGLSPTCTEPGLSEETFCAICYTVIISHPPAPQTVLPRENTVPFATKSLFHKRRSPPLTSGKPNTIRTLIGKNVQNAD